MENETRPNKQGYMAISAKKIITLTFIIGILLTSGGGYAYYKNLQNAIQAARGVFAEKCVGLIYESRSNFTNYANSTYKPDLFDDSVGRTASSYLSSLNNSIGEMTSVANINSKYVGANEALETLDLLKSNFDEFQVIKQKQLSIELRNPYNQELAAWNRLATDPTIIYRTILDKNYSRAFIEIGQEVGNNWRAYVAKEFDSDDKKLYGESYQKVQQEYVNLGNICREAKE